MSITLKNSRAIKQRAKQLLEKLPGITGVGIGLKMRNGEPTGDLAVLVSVEKKKPITELNAGEVIPAEIDGLKTDVFQCGHFQPRIGLPDETRYRPLKGGCRIRIRTAPNATASGTLGCFARTTRDPVGQIVMLANEHFFHGPSVSGPSCWGCTKGSSVGQPTLNSNDIMGNFLRAVMDNTVDAGIATLPTGTQYLNEVIDLTHPIKGTHAVTQDFLLNLFPDKYNIHKRGATTGVTHGWLASVDFDPTNVQPERPVIENQLLILPLPATSDFSDSGDSGSVVVNDDGFVMGLFSNSALDPNTGRESAAVASPIEDVKSKLAIELETATALGQVQTVTEAAVSPSTTTSSAGAFASTLSPQEHQRLQHQVDEDLTRSDNGNLVLAFWQRHQHELNALINYNRRVATVWHRSGAASLFQSVFRAVYFPDAVVPSSVDGKPVNECIESFLQVLLRFAGEELRRDVFQYRDRMPELGGKTYQQIVMDMGD